MSGGPRPQCEATIWVDHLELRCSLDRDHNDDHSHPVGYKTPGVTWHQHKWISMVLAEATP